MGIEKVREPRRVSGVDSKAASEKDRAERDQASVERVLGIVVGLSSEARGELIDTLMERYCMMCGASYDSDGDCPEGCSPEDDIDDELGEDGDPDDDDDVEEEEEDDDVD